MPVMCMVKHCVSRFRGMFPVKLSERITDRRLNLWNPLVFMFSMSTQTSMNVIL